MEKLTMTQFRNYCNEHNGATYTYDSRNTVSKRNERYNLAPISCHHVGYYRNVIVMLNPNAICFKAGDNTLQFSGVEEITIDRESLEVCDVIYITTKWDDSKHVIMVDRPRKLPF